MTITRLIEALPAALIVVAAGLTTSGCSVIPVPPVESVGSLTTNRLAIASGAVSPLTSFTTDDTIYFYVKLSWSDAAFSQGYKSVEWRWIKNEKIVAESTSRYLLKSKPFGIRTHIRATELGTGSFMVAAYLDGKRIDKVDFVIEPANVQAKTVPSCESCSAK